MFKAMLVAISRAFDLDAVDRLLFLSQCSQDFLVVSGDGLLHFARLIAAWMASGDQKANNNWQIVTYAINITPKGKQLIEAWRQGDRTRLNKCWVAQCRVPTEAEAYRRAKRFESADTTPWFLPYRNAQLAPTASELRCAANSASICSR